MKTKLERKHVERLIFRNPSATRFTQDTPVLPDVWIAYVEKPNDRQDLILTPHTPCSAGELAKHLRLQAKRAGKSEEEVSELAIAYNSATVAAKLTFEELVQLVLPMSRWWQNADKKLTINQALKEYFASLDYEDDLVGGMGDYRSTMFEMYVPFRLAQMVMWNRHPSEKVPKEADSTLDIEPLYPPASELKNHVDELKSLLKGAIVTNDKGEVERPRVYSVNRNRQVLPAIQRSVASIKADAVSRLFHTSSKDIRWAVLDSGIDATHPAFLKFPAGEDSHPNFDEDWSSRTRVVATYDFTFIRRIMSPDKNDWADLPTEVREERDRNPERFQELRMRLLEGRDIEWALITPYIQVHHDKRYRPPFGDHGTHVAGIIGASWQENEYKSPPDGEVLGVCPDIQLIDLRVFDVGRAETEFAVIAAMQFLRHQNANQDVLYVHGANLSLSIRHDVSNYACGCTPVCMECERLVNAGIVVVAAAGNDGHLRYQTEKGLREGYFSVSITDPGNAEAAITVGSTHRFQPHTYGVSYFSSRGPTGDGRLKPDLVAPGERIFSTISSDHSELFAMDGTSMSAPHVSGVAALLMSRHREFIGKPNAIKQILCSTATDLGREKYFQGAGMVDALRAIQSI